MFSWRSTIRQQKSNKMITVNGQQYAWGDITIMLWGQPVVDAKGIEYKVTQKQEYLYSTGREPRGVQLGEKEYTGSLTILQSEIEALNRTARAKGYDSIVGVPVDIVIMYSADLVVTIDKLKSVYFSEFNKGMKQGDMQSEHSLPFKALGLKEGIAG